MNAASVICGISLAYPILMWGAMKTAWYVNRIAMTALYEKCVSFNSCESIALGNDVKDYLETHY